MRSAPPAQPARGPRPLATAQVPSHHVALSLIWILRLAMYALVALSVLGTFYALREEAAPLFDPLAIIADVSGNLSALWGALLIQALLMLGQWGGVELASGDKRWWLLYGGCLVASVAANWNAYMPPLTAPGVGPGLPWFWAALIVVMSDVLPEWLLKR